MGSQDTEWRVRKEDILGHEGYRIWEGENPIALIYQAPTPNGAATNADLIAAAPSMLDALQRVHNEMMSKTPMSVEDSATFEIVRKAILLAKGMVLC